MGLPLIDTLDPENTLFYSEPEGMVLYVWKMDDNGNASHFKILTHELKQFKEVMGKVGVTVVEYKLYKQALKELSK